MVTSIKQVSQLKLTIDNLDFSNYLHEYQANYSSVNPLSGVSYLTGTLVLKKPIDDNSIDFDPRFSTTFVPGRLIELKQDGLNLPLGFALIINSNFDLKTTLTIDFGCRLSANNSKTLKTTSLCIDFGALYPVGDAIKTLLVAAGLTELQFSNAGIVDLSKYYLPEPFQVNDGQSLVQAASQLAGQFGRLMYQDNTGFVRFISTYTTSTNYSLIGHQKDFVAYSISSQPEQALKLLEVEYGESKVLTPLGTTSSSASSNEISIESLTQRNEVTKTLTNVISEYRDIGAGQKALVQQTTVVSQFEAVSNQPRTGQLALVNECFPNNKSRLLSKITTTISNNTEVLQTWLHYKANATIPTSYSVSGLITSSQVTENYQYFDNSVTIEKTEVQPIAKVIPLIGDRQLNSTNSVINDIPPLTNLSAYKVITVWSKSLQNSTKWTQLVTEYINKSLAEPGSLEARSQLSGVNLQNIIDNGQELVPIKSETLFNQSEPKFETFDDNTEVITETFNFTIGSPFNNGLIELLNLGNFYEPDELFLQDLAINYFNFANGRLFGCTAGCKLPESVYWGAIAPLSLAKVKELNNLNFAYWIDSPSLTYSSNEIVIGFTGSLIGTTTNQGDNYFADSVIPLPNMPVSVANKVYQFDGLEYVVTNTVFSIS
jgi:hypothetical protein